MSKDKLVCRCEFGRTSQTAGALELAMNAPKLKTHFKLRCGEAKAENLAVIISMVFEIEMQFHQCST